MEKSLPAIPAKRYFTIGEVSELCGVKPYVLRYWEQEFTQLKPMKRRGNRRYYQHHEVLLIRRIRELLYDQGFTISGARNRLADGHAHPAIDGAEVTELDGELAEATIRAHADGETLSPVHRASLSVAPGDAGSPGDHAALLGHTSSGAASRPWLSGTAPMTATEVRAELLAIRGLLFI